MEPVALRRHAPPGRSYRKSAAKVHKMIETAKSKRVEITFFSLIKSKNEETGAVDFVLVNY